MKTPITFLSNKLILILALLVAGFLLLPAEFFPKSAKQQTVFDNNEKIYLNQCPQLSAIKQTTNENEQLKIPFILLNWNIYKQQKQGWLTQLEQWQDKADLITLQEVKYSAELEQFREDNKLFSLQNIAFIYKENIYGVNTYSKNQASFVCGTRTLEPWLRVYKSAIATVYPIDNNNKSLLLINIHAVNFTFTPFELQRQIQPYLALIKNHQGPVIFSGDFNSWNTLRLNEIENSLFSIGFKEVLFANDQRITVFTNPLDHIYFRGLKASKAENLITEASDHTALRVVFNLE